jgi:splicing factor 3B subunit 1
MGARHCSGAEYVPAREWMRICFELLEMLKAHKKGIRRATVNTFGYIAKVRPWHVLLLGLIACPMHGV